MGIDETTKGCGIMGRTRDPYRISKHPRWDNGKLKESLRWNIHFKDHLQIEHRIAASSDKSTSEYVAKKIIDIVALKESNRPLTAELRKFIESQSHKLREKLCSWNILDLNTSAGFEPLMIFTKADLLFISPSNTSSEAFVSPNILEPIEARDDLPPSKLDNPPKPD